MVSFRYYRSFHPLTHDRGDPAYTRGMLSYPASSVENDSPAAQYDSTVYWHGTKHSNKLLITLHYWMYVRDHKFETLQWVQPPSYSVFKVLPSNFIEAQMHNPVCAYDKYGP